MENWRVGIIKRDRLSNITTINKIKVAVIIERTTTFKWRYAGHVTHTKDNLMDKTNLEIDIQVKQKQRTTTHQKDRQRETGVAPCKKKK